MNRLVCLTALLAVSFVFCQDENPSIENCGISKVTANGNKIVGGRNALEGEFPWQLSLEMRMVPVLTNYQHICGASVINERFAVTAAHCIAGGYFTTYRVSAGAQNITTRTTPSKHMVIPYVHEQYNPVSSLKNDIALLRLTTPLDIQNSNGLINGVCLPDRSQADNVTGMGTVSGWGTTSQGGSLSKTLRAVDVPIITDAQCREAYEEVEDTMLCAGYPEGGKDSCQGDSGGPFVQNQNGASYLIGIVSWGKGCAQANNPGVYTETAYYLDWIVRTMSTLGGGSGSPSDQGTGPSVPSNGSGAAPEGPGSESLGQNTPALPEGIVIKNDKGSFIR